MILFLCQVTLLLEFSPLSSGALTQGLTPRVTPQAAVTRSLGILRARRQVLEPGRASPPTASESGEKGKVPRDCGERSPGLSFSILHPAIPVAR